MSMATDNIKESYLELYHGLLHALYIKDHLDQLLNGLGQLGLGAGGGGQPLHCFFVLSRHTDTEEPSQIQKQTNGHVCSFWFRVCCRVYLSIVDLQGVELVGIFGEVGGAPDVARLLFVNTQEVVQCRVFVVKLFQLVASDGRAHSSP